MIAHRGWMGTPPPEQAECHPEDGWKANKINGFLKGTARGPRSFVVTPVRERRHGRTDSHGPAGTDTDPVPSSSASVSVRVSPCRSVCPCMASPLLAPG